MSFYNYSRHLKKIRNLVHYMFLSNLFTTQLSINNNIITSIFYCSVNDFLFIVTKEDFENSCMEPLSNNIGT